MPDKVQQFTTQYTRAAVQPATLNVETRTVEVVFATETPVSRRHWDIGEFVEVLSCDKKAVDFSRLNAGGPVLDCHSRYEMSNQIGVVENPRIEDGKCVATLRFSKRADVEPIFQDVQDGIYRNISVGYDVTEYTVTESEGKLPVYRATRWTPGEISLVTIPADINAGVRDKESLHNATILHSKNKRNMDEVVTTPEVTTTAPAVETTVETATPPVVPTAEEVRSQTSAAERTRAAEIMTACRTVGLDETFAATLVAGKLNLDEARAAIINEKAKTTPNISNMQTTIKVSADEADKQRTGIITALSLRSGAAEKEFTAEAIAHARQYRSDTLLDVAKAALSRADIDYKNMDKMDLVGRAITSHSSDFPILLEGTVRRTLLAAYTTTSDVWKRFCAIGSVSDFRDYKRLRTGSISNLDTVLEDAEYKTKQLPDGSYETVNIGTKGNLINVSRKMIINDDLGALTRLTAMLGRAAARSVEADVFALLASNPTMQDGVALFHGTHGNLATAAAPTVAVLDGMRQLMKVQMEPGSNDYLNLAPSIALSGVAVGSTLKLLNMSQFDNTDTKVQKPNITMGMFKDIIDSPRISGTAYYAFADPNEEPVLEVNFLDGNQTPFLDSQNGWNVDGVEWKIRLDYGVDAVGWRGAVKNVGA